MKTADAKINGTDLLNKCNNYLVDQATKKGLNIADDFASVDEWKKFVTGYTLKTLIELGMDACEAWDLVFGDGSYGRLAQETWEKLQARD